MELYEPWPDGYKITGAYGPRVHPKTRVKRTHHGVDVAMPTGTQLTAPADGVVVHKGTDWHTLSRVGKIKQSAGNNLIIRHPDDWHTVYYHLERPTHLRVGDEVKVGEPIGLVGNTGGSTGPHLHFELRESRTWGDTTDPAPHFVGKYKAPIVAPTPDPEPVEPAPVTPVERPTIQPTPRPEPLTPKPRTPNLNKTPRIDRIRNIPAPPLTMTKRLQDWFDMKRRMR